MRNTEGSAAHPLVIGLARSPLHHFSKEPCSSIRLIAAHGVEGDAHAGERVQHRSRVRANPDQPNLRQVHLIQSELFDELREKGYDLSTGAIGENILTRGIDLLALPTGARLHLGEEAVVELTGLRNPCQQLNDFRPGLMQGVLDRGPENELIRRCGVMSIVITSGTITLNDPITITLPNQFYPLHPV